MNGYLVLLIIVDVAVVVLLVAIRDAISLDQAKAVAAIKALFSRKA